MEAIEFTGKIEQGVIRLPEEWKEYQNVNARIIILIDEPKADKQKDRIREIFQQMSQLPMFQNIEDPVKWQKNMRNEWE